VLWRPEHDWLIEQLDEPLYRLPALIARKAGPRRTEILTLTKHDLSEKGWSYPGVTPKLGHILVRRQKKRDPATPRDTLPIEYAIVQACWKLFKGRPAGHQHVFGNAADVPPDPDGWSSQFSRRVSALGEQHGIDARGVCLHSGRHTATGKMQEHEGVNAHTAKRMGGWGTVAQVETYTRVPDASMKIAAAALARTYKPKAPRLVKLKKTAAR
jgi:integrase